eukprot:756220-Hanusia_phi.AAC.1
MIIVTSHVEPGGVQVKRGSGRATPPGPGPGRGAGPAVGVPWPCHHNSQSFSPAASPSAFTERPEFGFSDTAAGPAGPAGREGRRDRTVAY